MTKGNPNGQREDDTDIKEDSRATESGRSVDSDTSVSRESAAARINPGNEGTGAPSPTEPETEA
jgi:hypothetical protein